MLLTPFCCGCCKSNSGKDISLKKVKGQENYEFDEELGIELGDIAYLLRSLYDCVS